MGDTRKKESEEVVKKEKRSEQLRHRQESKCFHMPN
jgi:hypothetical protein